MEKKLDYDFAAGERCISVLNEVLEQYNRICSDTEGSLQNVTEAWQGEQSGQLRMAADNTSRSLQKMKLELNSLSEALKERHQRMVSTEEQLSGTYCTGV